MNDRIRFHYAEAQIDINCAVCDAAFTAFPDSDDPTINCPGCGREYEFVFKLQAKNNKEILKKRLKDYTHLTKS